jgi:hypothetical protein
MAETAPPPATATPDAPVVADNSVTRATYDETKALAEERAAKLAAAEARLAHYQSLDKAQLKAWAPTIETHLDTLCESASPEAKEQYATMKEWARTCHERANLEHQMPMARALFNSAQTLQTVTANASVQSATAEELSKSKRRGEELQAENETKDRRIGELQNSLAEMQANAEKLQEQLQKAGMLQNRTNFSIKASREADAPKGEGEKEDLPATVVLNTENASKQRALVDPGTALFNFVNASSGSASARFVPTGTSHQLLGAAAANELSIGAALRPM